MVLRLNLRVVGFLNHVAYGRFPWAIIPNQSTELANIFASCTLRQGFPEGALIRHFARSAICTELSFISCTISHRLLSQGFRPLHIWSVFAVRNAVRGTLVFDILESFSLIFAHFVNVFLSPDSTLRLIRRIWCICVLFYCNADAKVYVPLETSPLLRWCSHVWAWYGSCERFIFIQSEVFGAWI